MITFIIPSIGKPTLQEAINSIENQTSGDWKAIIIFDGVEPTVSVKNPKFSVLKVDKKGVGKNGAGYVRNYGMQFVETEWIAFLDDDDTIAPDYVETFKEEHKTHPFVDVIIFRMHRPNIEPVILPILNTDNFYMYEVGISFALRTDIFKKGFAFEPSHVEDFEYLSKLRENNYCIMISPHVKYYVDRNDEKAIVSQLGNRVIINGKNEGFTNRNYDSSWFLPFFLLFLLCFVLLFAKKIDKYRENSRLLYFGAIVFCIILLLLK
jgi:glycosyltransferase involved in cell wall biosynthesis